MSFPSKQFYWFLSLFLFLPVVLLAQRENKDTKIVVQPLRTSPNFNSLRYNQPTAKTTTPYRTADFDYPLNDCFTYTYKIEVGNPSQKIAVQDLLTATNGYSYTAGQIIFSNGQKDALIQRIGYNSNLDFTVAVGIKDPSGSNNADEVINSIKELPNGKLIFIGTATNTSTGEQHLFIGQADTTGTVDWIKQQASEGYEGIAISPTPSAGIGFVGQSGADILYGKLNYNGDLQWLKTVSLMSQGEVKGMINDESVEWYIAYTGIDSLRKVGALIQIHPANGDIGWVNRFGGKASNTDFIFHSLELVNLRPKISGIFTTGSEGYRFFRASVNILGPVELFLDFRSPNMSIDTTARSSLNANSEVLAFQPNKTDPSLYLLKMVNEYGYDTVIAWKKTFVLPANNQLATVEQTFDGGFLAISNLKTNGSAVFLKTDSAGYIKGCEGSDYALTAHRQFPVPYYTVSSPTNDIWDDFTTASFVETHQNPTVVVACKELTCPPVALPDACLQSYIRLYRGTSNCDLGLDLYVSPQNEVYMVGTMRDDPYEPSSDWSTLVKLKANGQLLTRKKVKLGNASNFVRLVPMHDGSFLTLGSSAYRPATAQYDTGYITITKYTKDFGFQWNKSLPIYGPYSAMYGLLESSDGSIFLHYIEGKNWCESIRILKLNANGDLLWVKNYNTANVCTFGYQGSLTQDDDYLYASSFANGTAGALLMKIKKATGAVVWTKGYTIAGANESLLSNDITFIGENLALFGRVSNDQWSKGVLLIVNKDGDVQRAKSFYNGKVGFNLKMIATQNKELVLISPDYTQEGFIRMDSALNVLYAKTTQSKGTATWFLKEGPDGSIYTVGQYLQMNNYNAETALKKYNYDGLLGNCAADTFAHSITNQPIVASRLSTQVTDHHVVLETLPYQEKPYSLQLNDLLCATVSNCSTVRLTGQPKVCDTATKTFTVERNIGCTLPVFFTYSGDSIRVQSKTDSSITLQFLRPGAAMLKARIFNGCQWIEDSLAIVANPGLQSLALGPDTTICSGNALVLHADKGFASYQWQDGTTDSVYTVTKPGTYSVETIDGCSGNVFRDTVIVSLAPPIPFEVGPDRTKCNSDTLQLNAPSGFLNYAWSNNYNISSLTSQNVVVNPLVDTIYFIKAEKTPGCFAYDTIKVNVYTSPPIDLGADKSFCFGDSALLDAGSGFVAYHWSTGAAGQVFSVKTIGSYSVEGTTLEGCISRDTMEVLQVYPLPQPQLYKQQGLCFGESRMLDAGSYAKYLWQDGSTQRTYTVNDIGRYFVTVTDNNGCRGSDTTAIATIYPLPAGFLPADTAICSYGNLELKPSPITYNDYLWSTGERTPSIVISTPGFYTLQVVDEHQCIGRDTINVFSKECLAGFFIPTAFTPNGDGRNDIFRPLLFGTVKQYHFTVFNRWGEVVFQTSELTKGWNGKVAGKDQETSTFVWACSYQFEGEPIKTQKGTVTVIR